jgi:hypothetical protein
LNLKVLFAAANKETPPAASRSLDEPNRNNEDIQLEGMLGNKYDRRMYEKSL